jgi:ABC-2 type transport system permease protein
MRNITLIAKREYKEQIRGRAFLLSTILLPVIFVLLIGVGYLTTMSLGSGKHIVIAADSQLLAEKVRTRLLAKKNNKLTVDIAPSASRDEQAALLEHVKDKSLDGLLVIESPAGQAVPTVTYTSKSAGDFMSTGRFESAVNDGLVQERLARTGTAQDVSDALVKGVDIQTFQMKKNGAIVKSNAIASFYKGYVMAILLSMTTIIYGLNVARSIIQEKTSRIFEVMLSIAKPGDLLAGKLIGVGAVGLTQILIWVIAAAIILALPIAQAQLTGNLAIHFTWAETILFPVYFVLGYFLYSSLFAGLAATCETEQELQMFTPLAAVPVWLSFALILLIANDSNSVWSVLASLFPPCTPIIMFLRMGSEVPPLWQLGLSIVLMMLTIWGLLWLSSKLYRVGILMYGKRATLPELMRWLRYS